MLAENVGESVKRLTRPEIGCASACVRESEAASRVDSLNNRSLEGEGRKAAASTFMVIRSYTLVTIRNGSNNARVGDCTLPIPKRYRAKE